MEHLESLRLPLFLGLFVILFLTEGVVRARPWHHARGKRLGFHVCVSVCNTVVTRLVVTAPFAALLLWVESHHWGARSLLGLVGWQEIVATLIVCDFFDYWWHRFSHEWPFLWRFHRIHHLDTHVDVTTSLRFHPGELFLSYMAKSFWVLVWGPTLIGFVIFEAAITAYSQFHHSNIDFPDRVEKVLRWVHMTPRLHAGHHTVTVRTRNANYTTIFLIWDRLFGTLQEVDREELKTLGLPEARDKDLAFGYLLKAPFKFNRGKNS